MSIQWTLIAGFLYLEIAVVLLLVLPVASPRKWQRIFCSRFLNALRRQASFYFYVVLFILVLLLLDAIREMRKYSHTEVQDKSQAHLHLDAEMQNNMRLFRAQRNSYISGFALFLSLVIRRLCILISSLAYMQAQSEAALKQAASATTTATNLLSQGAGEKENSANEAHAKELEDLKTEYDNLKKELEKERRDKESLKKQAESTNAEYDRLSEEYNKLQKKLVHSSDGDKKDD